MRGRAGMHGGADVNHRLPALTSVAQHKLSVFGRANDQYSHAGPLASGRHLRGLPAWAAATGWHFLGLPALELALILHCPLVGRSPSLRVRLVVAVPVVRGSRRVQIVAALNQEYMPVSKKDAISLHVRKRSFL